jgi:hypothetical protein
MNVKPVVARTKPIGDLFRVLTLLRPSIQAPSGEGAEAECYLAVVSGKMPVIVVDVQGRSLRERRPERSIHLWPIASEIQSQLAEEGLVETSGEHLGYLTEAGFRRWITLRNEQRFAPIA